MNTNHEKGMTDIIAINALAHYFDQYRELHFLGGFKNLVYEFKESEDDYILRLTTNEHRQLSDILGELDWIQYLSESGVEISTPLRSLSGNLLELVIIDDQTLIACVFRKAIGKQLTYPDYLGNAAVFEELGKMTGKIHKASKQYEPYKNKRYENFDGLYMHQLVRQMLQENSYMHTALDSLKNTISQFEKDKESYGLIHGDINIGNFCISENEITLFDFDECHYSWYVEDIAIQLYYTIYVMLDDGIEARQQMSDLFMTTFMNGYLLENVLDQKWIELIPVFLRLRELIVHIGLYRSWDFENLNPWRKNYYEQSRARIISGVPVVESRTEWYGSQNC